MYHYSYIVGIVYLLLLLIFLPIVRKSRKFVIWTALIWAPLAPVLEYWHHKDYWSPTYLMPIHIGNWRFGVEDYLFGLVFAGICAGLFDRFASKQGHKTKVQCRPSDLVTLLSLSLVGGPIGMFVLSSLLGLNSLYAVIIMEVSIAIIVLIRRPDWITAALQTAFLLGAGFWVSYYIFYLRLYPHIIDYWWYRDIIDGVSLGGIPFEEVMWAMMSGLCIGPVSRLFLVRRDLKDSALYKNPNSAGDREG